MIPLAVGALSADTLSGTAPIVMSTGEQPCQRQLWRLHHGAMEWALNGRHTGTWLGLGAAGGRLLKLGITSVSILGGEQGQQTVAR